MLFPSGLPHYAESLFLQVGAHMKSKALQLVQNGAENIQDSLPPGSYENADGSDHLETKAVSEPSRPQVVQDDPETTFPRQCDRFGFTRVDRN